MIDNAQPLIKYGKIIPNYFILEDGSVFHSKRNKIRKPVTRPDGYQMICVSIPENLFDDYEYFLQVGKTKPNKSSYS